MQRSATGWLAEIYASHKTLWRGFGSLVAGIAIWESLKPVINPFFFSVPSEIVRSLYKVAISGELLPNYYVSMAEFTYGYILGVAAAIPLGLVVGRIKLLEDVLDPYIVALYATPKVALAPLFILMFGVGMYSKIVLVILGVFFPVFVNTFYGAKHADKVLVEAAICFGAKKQDMFFKVIMPSALPYIVAGLRLAIGIGLIFVVVGEFTAATEGIGHMIAIAAGQFDTALVLGGVIVLSITGMVLTEALKRLEQRIAPWQTTQL